MTEHPALLSYILYRSAAGAREDARNNISDTVLGALTDVVSSHVFQGVEASVRSLVLEQVDSRD